MSTIQVCFKHELCFFCIGSTIITSECIVIPEGGSLDGLLTVGSEEGEESGAGWMSTAFRTMA